MSSLKSQAGPLWEDYKTEIIELYATKTLQEVRGELMRTHGFTATLKQWKNQLAKWDLKKNIHPPEYRAMVRKKRQRAEVEGKNTQFFIDGVEVPPAKLVRYESRKGRNKRLEEGPEDAATPPSLTCRTPPPSLETMVVVDGKPSPSFKDFHAIDDLGAMALTAYSPIPTDRTCFESFFCPETFAMPWQLEPPSTIPRAPTPDQFDWFGSYIEYAESTRSKTPQSKSRLTQLLTNFARALDSYDEQIRYQLRFGEFLVPHSSTSSQKFEIVLKLLDNLNRISTNATDTKEFGKWAQAVVDKVIRCYQNDDRFMAILGLIVGAFYFIRGDMSAVKMYMDHAILEMKRVGEALEIRAIATEIVALYYTVLGDYQRGDKLKKLSYEGWRRAKAQELIE
ncbi:uncharacterized protein PAC_19327 [Phialocephala subalpina]|uniref:Clr5 domain-containing protein n=1 Tax=Phialocephala subalpina TaxID=576137 RepID=A0A1L7XWP0_9HELO|nr:uncharacterized protein PAC_19327 [Phialocephala subalpina]